MMGELNNRAHTVIENLKSFFIENDAMDYTVKVEDVEFRCNRSLLAASSHFFRALIRTDMMEAKEDSVTLKGMSVSTVQTILKALNTGLVKLKADDFMDVWRAVDQLQIEFLMEECEVFALKVLSVDNCLTIWKTAVLLDKDNVKEKCEESAAKAISLKNFEDIYKTAKDYNSMKVLDACRKFMLKNFDEVSKMTTMMELPFQELLSLVEDRDLNVSSEDTVLETVMKWVEHVPNVEEDFNELNDYKEKEVNKYLVINLGTANFTEKCMQFCIEIPSTYFEINNEELEYDQVDICLRNNTVLNGRVYKNKDNTRTKVLVKLLSSVRMCLVSTPLLEQLLKHKLICITPNIRNIITDVILYKTAHYNHGQWRTAALHRANSEFEHCGVFFNGEFSVITAFDEKVYKCVKDDELSKDVSLVVFDSTFCAVGARYRVQSKSSLCVLNGNSWIKIAEIPGRDFILVPYELSIFCVNKSKAVILQIFPKGGKTHVLRFVQLPRTFKAHQAIIYHRSLLIFSSITTYGLDKTVIYQLDILSKEFRELGTIPGPAEQLISFKDDDNTYILQTNGDLWKIVDSTDVVVQFEHLCSLWNIRRKLHGALTYEKKLIIFGPVAENEPAEQNRKEHLEGYFTEIKYWGHDMRCSNFIPVVLPKSEMFPW